MVALFVWQQYSGEYVFIITKRYNNKTLGCNEIIKKNSWKQPTQGFILWYQCEKIEKKLNSYGKNFPTRIGLTLYKENFEKYKGKFVMSVFWIFRSFYALISCLMALVCIPEVQTHLLTPILPYLDMTNVRCRLCHLWQKYQKCHIWCKCHLTYVMSRYGNMGVKRSVCRLRPEWT